MTENKQIIITPLVGRRTFWIPYYLNHLKQSFCELSFLLILCVFFLLLFRRIFFLCLNVLLLLNWKFSLKIGQYSLPRVEQTKSTWIATTGDRMERIFFPKSLNQCKLDSIVIEKVKRLILDSSLSLSHHIQCQ